MRWIAFLTLNVLILGGALGLSQRYQPPFPTATPSPFPSLTPSATVEKTAVEGPKLMATCHAEPKWTYLLNVRRGPSNNWGIIRNFAHNVENHEFWVFGRTEDWKWFHVVPNPPNENFVGWIWHEQLNLFGACLDLPITDAIPEITLDDVPPPPAPVAAPAFAADYLDLSEFDRAWLVREGVIYIRRDIKAEQQRDRLQAHLVMLDFNDPRLEAGVRIGAIPAVGGKPTSTIATDAGAFLAINGDFYAGNYFPQGMTVIDGEVVTAPKRRAAFGITHDRQPHIGYFTEGWTWAAEVRAANGEVIPLQLMNVPCDLLWLCLYTHHRAGRLPQGFGGVRVLLDENFGVQNIVQDVGIDIPLGYSVLAGGLQTGQWLLDNVQLGDTLQISRPTTPPWEDFHSVIGGGPRLLWDGELWEDCYPVETPPCEEFDFKFRDSHYGLKSLPRSAVGYNDANLIYILMVEGYEVDDSGGATRRELADMFLQYGAVQAMEFDGGGSSSLYMLPNGLVSDVGYEGERPVSNALLFFWNED